MVYWRSSEEKLAHERTRNKVRMELAKLYQSEVLTTEQAPFVSTSSNYTRNCFMPPKVCPVTMAMLYHSMQLKIKDFFMDPVETYESIFENKDKDYYQNVFLQGDPGSGKTAFCRKLVQLWTDDVLGIADKRISVTSEPRAFKDEHWFTNRYDLLFYIKMKDCKDLCVVEDMINLKIFSKLSSIPKDHWLLNNLLSNDRCLVIIDGLDEWTHNEEICDHSSTLLPHRRCWDTVTFLSTSRNWKMEEMFIRSSELHGLFQIFGPVDSKQMIKSTITDFNILTNKSLKEDDFFADIRRHNLDTFLVNPMFAMYLASCWHNYRDFEDSRCEMYAGILDMMFERTLQRPAEEHFLETEGIKDLKMLPKCFANTRFCHWNKSLLDKLGRFAFEVLFNRSGFYTAQDILCEDLEDLLSPKSIHKSVMCLGVLTRQELPDLSSDLSLISFLDLSIQQFLAAYFVSTLADDEINNVVRKIVGSETDKMLDIFDVAQLLVFVFGMNPGVGTILSEAITDMFDDYIDQSISNSSLKELIEPIFKLQQILLDAYEECLRNGHQQAELSLHHFVNDGTLPTDRLVSFGRILDMNMAFIRTLCFQDVEVDLSQISKVASSSSNHLRNFVLKNVSDTNQEPACLDISRCQHLQRLILSYVELSDVKLSRLTLLHCELRHLNKTVEKSITQSIVQDGNLRAFKLVSPDAGLYLTSMVPNLRHLQFLEIGCIVTDTGEFACVTALERLEVLSVICAQLPGTFFSTVQGLMNLKALRLKGTSLDAFPLSVQPRLEEIVFSYVSLTATVLQHIMQFMKRQPRKLICVMKQCKLSSRGEFTTIIVPLAKSYNCDLTTLTDDLVILTFKGRDLDAGSDCI